jgi:cytochrome c oxidase subunit 2
MAGAVLVPSLPLLSSAGATFEQLCWQCSCMDDEPMWSTLEAAGRGAAEVAGLLGVMASGAVVVWVLVTMLALHALRSNRIRWSERAGLRLIVAGGVVLPVIVLSALMFAGMPLLSRQLKAAPSGALRIHVSGEQWWWRVRYEPPGAEPIELANELRLPLGQAVEVVLTSVDVIHAFWVPSLAGKVDMIPGRVTRLLLEPERTGVFRGICAEYCGASHARMGFAVEVMEAPAFAQWLSAQAQPAATIESDGSRAFASSGCAACHAVRGTDAFGSIGPDLTHVGSRMTLAGGVLPNTTDDLERFIASPAAIKPGALMPPFGSLPPTELRALAVYLKDLR